MIDDILKRNQAWSDAVRAKSPDFFPRLASQQTPEFFWIGCSDSRVPANVVAGLDPGEVFVHRNVANVIHSSDMNMLSTLEFAVNVLKVREVMITGHYGCGGVIAAMDGVAEGLTEHWLEPVRRLARRHQEELAGITDRHERIDRLCELNVLDSVARVAETPVIRRAWARGQEVNLHGLIYGLKDGKLRDLDCSLLARDMGPKA
ncbi:MAG: carbonic anhydrase [Rhodobacteraceae bacterium]|nr:carbonic anhydrase [Paracoccaceae bacterium]